jgi:hypothetical protein
VEKRCGYRVFCLPRVLDVTRRAGVPARPGGGAARQLVAVIAATNAKKTAMPIAMTQSGFGTGFGMGFGAGFTAGGWAGARL